MSRTLLAVAAVTALTGCGGAPADAADVPATHTMTVTFHLDDYDTAFFQCEGTGGYSDIGPGTSVTVRNGSGEILGVEPLGQGASSSNGVQARYCDWTVRIHGVPAGEGFYSVEVGSRGEVTASEEQLSTDGWQLAVALGG